MKKGQMNRRVFLKAVSAITAFEGDQFEVERPDLRCDCAVEGDAIWCPAQAAAALSPRPEYCQNRKPGQNDAATAKEGCRYQA